MSKYNNIERNIARFLNKYPKLKDSFKIIYQTFSFYLHRKKHQCLTNDNVSLRRISEKEMTSFWGYYDKSPSMGDEYCFHVYNHKKVIQRDLVNLDIFCGREHVSSSKSWNWQQGTMLTWLNENEIIHNFFDGKDYKSKIINIRNGKERIINYPIYSVNYRGDTSLSLNFTRLAKLRPDYGYFNKPYLDLKKTEDKDGVYVIDLKNNSRKLILSFKKLLNFNYDNQMKDCWHKVNHIDFSPSGDKFIFHHRWLSDEGVKKSRLMIANIDGSDLRELANDGMVSHCAWRNQDEIVGWMTKKGEGDNYFIINVNTGVHSLLGHEILKEDGHPSFSEDGNWMLTDTYPDKSRMSTLLLFNMKQNKLYILGEFFSPLRFRGELRCDLHPRFNPCEKKITFDSVHEGYRGLYEMDINKIIEK